MVKKFILGSQLTTAELLVQPEIKNFIRMISRHKLHRDGKLLKLLNIVYDRKIGFLKSNIYKKNPDSQNNILKKIFSYIFFLLTGLYVAQLGFYALKYALNPETPIQSIARKISNASLNMFSNFMI